MLFKQKVFRRVTGKGQFRKNNYVRPYFSGAFDILRDKIGPFVFLDTYIFVDTPDGTELVNGGFPGIEGDNIINFKDVNGKYLVRDYINLALKDGGGWVKYFWPKPGSDKPLEKCTYVKKVEYGGETFIVGCGAYLE